MSYCDASTMLPPYSNSENLYATDIARGVIVKSPCSILILYLSVTSLSFSSTILTLASLLDVPTSTCPPEYVTTILSPEIRVPEFNEYEEGSKEVPSYCCSSSSIFIVTAIGSDTSIALVKNIDKNVAELDINPIDIPPRIIDNLLNFIISIYLL